MTDQFTDDDPILVKVQKLVDKAWSTTFPAERDALLAKADALMLKYSIDQFRLLDPNRPRTAAPIKGQDPEMREIWYFGKLNGFPNVDYEITGNLHQIFYRLATHFQCRVGYFGWTHSKVVGFPADLDFLEMMFTSLKLHLLSKVDPSVTNDVGWETNVVALKQAGIKWEDIHRKMQVHDAYPYKGQLWQRNMGVRFTAVYKRWRNANPDEPHNLSSPKMWMRSFVQAYSYEIGLRLNEMATASAKTIDNLPALLNDKSNALKDLYDTLFPPPPEYKADPNSKTKIRRYAAPRSPAISTAAFQAGRAAARTADLNQRGSRVSGGDRGELR